MRQLLTCRCVSVMLLRSMQNNTTKELADAKAENDVAMMLPLVTVGCTSKQSVSQCVKPPPPPAWIMQPPRLADTAEWDYFTLRERLITMQKQLEGTRSILITVQIELPISMGNSCNLL